MGGVVVLIADACRFGWIEYDGARYCHEHGGFLEPGVQSMLCDRSPLSQRRRADADADDRDDPC